MRKGIEFRQKLPVLVAMAVALPVVADAHPAESQPTQSIAISAAAAGQVQAMSASSADGRLGGLRPEMEWTLFSQSGSQSMSEPTKQPTGNYAEILGQVTRAR